MIVADFAKQFRLNRSDHLRALEQVERYRTLVEGVQGYAIFMLDPKGYVVTWNRGAQKLKGYTAPEVIGKHFSIFYTGHARESGYPQQKLKEVIANGSIEDNGWRVKKDGTQFWANVVITALYDNDGSVTGFAKVTRDLTERKKQEEALLKANQELREQRAELKELNALKDEFVSLVSHQLRAPATGVKQYLGLMLEGYAGRLTDEQRNHVQHAYSSNERQLAMVDDLLRVAQVDSGHMKLNKRPTDIVALVQDVAGEHRDVMQSRNQTFVCHATEAQLSVDVDESRLRMVIENLIDNASKYTPDNGSISAAFSYDDSTTQIKISDSGVGIAPDAMPQLFKKFSRLPNELSNSVQGSGLGLYWAQKIVKLHDGRIDVSSKPGGGSQFTIILPA